MDTEKIIFFIASFLVGSTQSHYVIYHLIQKYKSKKVFRFAYKRLKKFKQFDSHMLKKICVGIDSILLFIFISIIYLTTDDEHTLALSALLTNLGHFFPIHNKLYSRSKHIWTIAMIGLILDYQMSLIMLVTFIITFRKFKYYAVANASAVTVCMIRSAVSIMITKTDYLVGLYFIILGIVVIVRNKTNLLHTIAGTKEVKSLSKYF